MPLFPYLFNTIKLKEFLLEGPFDESYSGFDTYL